MKWTVLAAMTLFASLTVGCGASQAKPADAAQAGESEESNKKVKPKGLDRVDRLIQ